MPISTFRRPRVRGESVQTCYLICRHGDSRHHGDAPPTSSETTTLHQKVKLPIVMHGQNCAGPLECCEILFITPLLKAGFPWSERVNLITIRRADPICSDATDTAVFLKHPA